MVYTRPAHGDPFADGSATDATIIVDALADGLEAVEAGTTIGKTLVTHPSTDDVLVQVYDVVNARWQRTHYDSGWRDLSGSLTNSWTLGSGGRISLRRVNDRVFWEAWLLKQPTDNTTPSEDAGPMNIPEGFRANSSTGWHFSPFTTVHGMAGYYSATADHFAAGAAGVVYPYWYNASPQTNRIVIVASSFGTWASGGTYNFEGSYVTSDDVPVSLPGALGSPAPYA